MFLEQILELEQQEWNPTPEELTVLHFEGVQEAITSVLSTEKRGLDTLEDVLQDMLTMISAAGDEISKEEIVAGMGMVIGTYIATRRHFHVRNSHQQEIEKALLEVALMNRTNVPLN